jgi:hypothetical protein
MFCTKTADSPYTVLSSTSQHTVFEFLMYSLYVLCSFGSGSGPAHSDLDPAKKNRDSIGSRSCSTTLPVTRSNLPIGPTIYIYPNAIKTGFKQQQKKKFLYEAFLLSIYVNDLWILYKVTIECNLEIHYFVACPKHAHTLSERISYITRLYG